MQAAKPATVVAAESSAVEVEGDVVATMEAYNLAMGRYTRTVRATLPEHAGYECKEPEPGKFTLAFPCALPSLFVIPVLDRHIASFRQERLLGCFVKSPAASVI